MRKTIGLAALAALTIAAPAVAAPDKTFNGGETPEVWEWDGAVGFGLSDVLEQVGCHEGANCDYTLFEVKEIGVLQIATTGNEETLIDGDIHLFLSDENGADGEEIATATNFTPDERVSVDVEPGFYKLMYAYSGVGSYAGKATWSPPPPPEEEEPIEE